MLNPAPVKTIQATYLSIETYTPTDGFAFTAITISRSLRPGLEASSGSPRARFHDHPTPSSMRRAIQLLAKRYLQGEHPEALQ